MGSRRPRFGLWPATRQIGEFQGWFVIDGATGNVSVDPDGIIASSLRTGAGRYTLALNISPVISLSNLAILLVGVVDPSDPYFARGFCVAPDQGFVLIDDASGAAADPGAFAGALFTAAN